MQISSYKRELHYTTNSAVIVINIILFLADFPSDICEWLLTTVEVFSFLTIVLISWKWQIKQLLRYWLRKIFRFSNFKK